MSVISVKASNKKKASENCHNLLNNWHLTFRRCPVRQIQGHPTRHWLESVGIWAAGEGSLSLRVENKLDSMRSWRGREGSGDQERTNRHRLMYNSI